MAKVTLEQIAERAGVSRRTVNRVLNGQGKVRPESEARVREALQELGYERNRAASALASSKYTKKVCIMYEKSTTRYIEEKASAGIEKARKELDEFGIEVKNLAVDSVYADRYLEHMEQLVAEGYCGFALKAPYSDGMRDYIRNMDDRNIPVVTFNTDIPDSRRLCYVGENLYLSGKIAGNIMARLVRKGEKVVAGYGFSQFQSHHDRVAGFRCAMQQAGFPDEDLILFHTDQEPEMTYACLEQCFREHENIRGIYMSIEPNEVCGRFLRENYPEATQRPFVVCHDIDPTTIRGLQEGIFDFVIDQDIAMQYCRALLNLRDAICFGIRNDTSYTESRIYNAAYFSE